MKRNRAASAEDLANLPEGKWVRFEGGIQAVSIDEDRGEDEKQVEITLPARVARDLKARRATEFKATLRGRRLVLRW